MTLRTNFNFRQQLHRRTLLKGAGVSMAMPWLSAMESSFGAPTRKTPRRFVAMTLGLGLLADNLNPKQTGREYESSAYLKDFDDLRKDFTVVSGSSHPGVGGGHRAESSLLSAAPMSAGIPSGNTISVDQLLAKHLGHETRFPSLVLALSGSNSPSYTENGSMIPAESSPSSLFTKLFIADTPADRRHQMYRAREGRSIMDVVADDTRSLKRRVGVGDRDRLDAYFTSVRDLEKRLASSEAWVNKPKPIVNASKPLDIANPNDFIARQRLMSDMIRLALSTDSSRFVVCHFGSGSGVVPLDGVEEGYHTLSHHGRDEVKLSQLAIVEKAIIDSWGDFLRSLKEVDERGESVLDTTSVLLTSNLGNASSHSNKNMPVLLAGGGFQHGQHLAFDQNKNNPLPNHYLSILQQTGLSAERFATSTGTMPGLEPTKT
ncbi:MAG: DUF1552 domain-containing protein [Planctomycetota bacterium]|nr:DUF1552 domain-containing protein [Planctomycetota bacterium]